jgi:hypothetical protein
LSGEAEAMARSRLSTPRKQLPDQVLGGIFFKIILFAGSPFFKIVQFGGHPKHAITIFIGFSLRRSQLFLGLLSDRLQSVLIGMHRLIRRC